MTQKRDKQGRFAPDGGGGPGRPRREPQQIRPEDEAEAADLCRRATILIAEFEALLARYPDA